MDIYDLIDPTELTGVARLELADEDREDNQFILGNWFPNNLVDAIDFEYSTGSNRRFTDAMPFRGFTTESPIGKRPGRAKKSGSMPPLSIKFPLTELDRIRQREASRQGGAAAAAVEGDVFDDITAGVRAAENRMEIARADAIVTGTASISENGVQLDVDFGRDAARALSVGTSWSDAANATPRNDEETVLETMSDEEGLSDFVAVMNRTTWKNWKACDQIRNAFPSFRVADALSVRQANEVRQDNDLPPVIIYNAMTNGVDGTSRKLIPDNKVIYLPRANALGDTQWGVPAIADEPEVALEQDNRPGPVAYMMRQLDPLVVWTVVDALGFPVMKDPNATFALTV